MVTYGSATATIRVNRAADAALAWGIASSAALFIPAVFTDKPKHWTMPAASTGAAMR
jgi:hypothetical protein